MKEIFPRVYKIRGKLATKNSTPGYRVYEERLIRQGDKEYRLWDPQRSKLAAGILNGLRKFPFSPSTTVLYLGASAGTTSSHLADITSLVYCLEISTRMMQDLIPVCQRKKNMIPILEDANHPERYSSLIPSKVEVLYQDVAQRNQAEILIKNAEVFLPKNAILAIKARSINSVENPRKIFQKEINQLKEKFKVLQIVNLRPYHKDHVLVSLRKK